MITCLRTLRHLYGFALFILAIPAFSQTNEELFREYQFNFSSPGARANAMGGAFIGLADDATASIANPAGLAFLTETAVTIEYRDRKRDGREEQILGSFFNSQLTQEVARLEEATFFSVNFRWKSWYFGVFQYDFLNERQSRRFIARTLDGDAGEGLVTSIEGRQIFLDLAGEARGFGVARRFGKWKAGLTLNALELTGRTNYGRRTTVIDIPPTVSEFDSSIDDHDTAYGFNLGVLHEPTERFSWGAVWRNNPRFTLQESVLIRENAQPTLNETLDVPFVTPDVFGAGLRYRIRPQLSLLLDWQRIFYSQIIEDGFLIVESSETETRDNYDIEDSDEIRVGAEWLFAGGDSVWALRAGYYRNPGHIVTYQGDDPVITDRFAAIDDGDENRATAGFGWSYRNRFEIDLSGQFWQDGREITLSLIWRDK